MSAGFTPGPWNARTERVISAWTTHKRCDGSSMEYQKDIAWTQPVGSTCEGARIANAHLIAAAPDLYEALSQLVAVSEGPLTDELTAALSALAKADGEA